MTDEDLNLNALIRLVRGPRQQTAPARSVAQVGDLRALARATATRPVDEGSQGEQGCPVVGLWDSTVANDALRVPRSRATFASRPESAGDPDRDQTRDTPTAPVVHWMERPSRRTRRDIGWSTWTPSRSDWRSWTGRSEKQRRPKCLHRPIESTEPEVLPSPTTPMAEGSTPLPAPMPESPTKPPAWKAKTTRGKKRQRDRCRHAKEVLRCAARRQQASSQGQTKGERQDPGRAGGPDGSVRLGQTENLPSAVQHPDDERRGDRPRACVRDNPNHRRQRPVAAHDRADGEDNGSAAEGSARGRGLSQWRRIWRHASKKM